MSAQMSTANVNVHDPQEIRRCTVACRGRLQAKECPAALPTPGHRALETAEGQEKDQVLNRIRCFACDRKCDLKSLQSSSFQESTLR